VVATLLPVPRTDTREAARLKTIRPLLATVAPADERVIAHRDARDVQTRVGRRPDADGEDAGGAEGQTRDGLTTGTGRREDRAHRDLQIVAAERDVLEVPRDAVAAVPREGKAAADQPANRGGVANPG